MRTKERDRCGGYCCLQCPRLLHFFFSPRGNSQLGTMNHQIAHVPKYTIKLQSDHQKTGHQPVGNWTTETVKRNLPRETHCESGGKKDVALRTWEDAQKCPPLPTPAYALLCPQNRVGKGIWKDLGKILFRLNAFAHTRAPHSGGCPQPFHSIIPQDITQRTMFPPSFLM